MAYFVDQLMNGLSSGAIYALIALGFAMVYGALRLLNFAHSEVFAGSTFAAYFALQWMVRWWGNCGIVTIGLAVCFAGTVGAIIALAIEFIAYRPLRERPKIESLLSAIGLSLLLQQLGIHIFSAHTRGFPVAEWGAPPRVLVLGLLAISFLTVYFLIHFTRLGIQIRAVAESPSTADLLGVSSSRVIRCVFFLGGFLAGVAGVAWGLVYGTVHPQMGFYPGMKAFMIAVSGGIGRLDGTMLFGVLLGVFESLLAAYLPSEISGFRTAILLAALLAFLAFRPAGLMGEVWEEKV